MKAKIYKTQEWIFWDGSDEEIIKKIDFLLKKTEQIILGEKIHKFQPTGITKVWLLAESHCALHSFPESKKVYIDLSSCNLEKQKKFNELFYNEFKITKEDE